MDSYGKEVIMDLYDCDISKFNREDIEIYFKELCGLIDMEKCDLHFWDYVGCTQEEIDEEPDHLIGTSAVQFIRTSTIVIHTLEILKTIYLNVFSCKDFEPEDVVQFSQKFFKGKLKNSTTIDRG